MNAPPGATLPPGATGGNAFGTSFDYGLGGATSHVPPTMVPAAPQAAVPGVGPTVPSNQGFERFTFQSMFGRLELRELLREDVERIRAQVDIPSLQKHIANIAYSDVRLEDLRNISDEQFVHVFKLAQLMMQYVIHGQEVLVRANEEHQRLYAQAEHKMRLLNEQFRLRVQEIAQLKAERAHRKKALSMYEFMLWSQSQNNHGGGQSNPVNQLVANMRQCKYCSRLFTADKMREHCARRHPGEIAHDGTPLGAGSVHNSMMGQQPGGQDQLVQALLGGLTNDGIAVPGASDPRALEHTIERKLVEVLDRRGMGHTDLADYEIAEPVGGAGGSTALAHRRRELQRVQSEAQQVEEQIARWQQELQRNQAKLIEVERQVEETKQRVSKSQETLEREKMRERMIQGRAGGGMTATGGSMMAAGGGMHPSMRHSWDPPGSPSRPAPVITNPAIMGTAPQFGSMLSTQGSFPVQAGTAPLAVPGRTYQDPQLQEGNHWEHPEHEISQRKKLLQQGLDQKLQSQEGLGLAPGAVFSDREYGYKEQELQERGRNERQLLAVPEAEYSRKAGELEREVRNKMRQDWRGADKVFGGTLESAETAQETQMQQLKKSLLQMPALSREAEGMIARLFDSANQSVYPQQALLASDMQRLQGLQSLLNQHDMHEIWHMMDMNHDDAVSFPEFKVFLMQAVVLKFQTLDVDCNGHISVEEVGPLAAEFGLTQHKCIEELDWDKDGVVYLDDFIMFSLKRVLQSLGGAQVNKLALRPKLVRVEAERVLRRVYDTHDVDGNGTLDVEEVLQVLRTVKLMNQTLPYKQQVELAMEQYQSIKTDPSGDVSFEEFRSWIIAMIERMWDGCDTRNAGVLSANQVEHGEQALCKIFGKARGLDFFNELAKEGFVDKSQSPPMLAREDFVSWVVMVPMQAELHKIARTTDPLYLHLPVFEDLPASLPPVMNPPGGLQNPAMAHPAIPAAAPMPGQRRRSLMQQCFQNLCAQVGGGFVQLTQLIDVDRMGASEWYQQHQASHISSAARGGNWSQQLSAVDFEQLMQQLLQGAFGRLDADDSGHISRSEVEEVISLLPGGASQHAMALQVLRDATAQDTHGDNVISSEQFAELFLEQVLKLGHDLQYFRAGTTTLATICNMGATAKLQSILARLYQKIIARDSHASRSSFGRLSELFSSAWGINASSNVLAKFVDPASGGHRLLQQDFIQFVSEILARAFNNLDQDHSGAVELREIEALAAQFGASAAEVLQRATRSGSRTSMKKSEFCEFVATRCLEELNSSSLEALSSGLAKVIQWGQPLHSSSHLATVGPTFGQQAPMPNKMQLECSRIFQALQRQDSSLGVGRAGSGVQGAVLREVLGEIRVHWNMQVGSHSTDAISSMLREPESTFLDEFRVIHFLSAVLQRCYDRLQHAGTVPLARVSGLLGVHSARYPELLSQEQLNSLVVDTVSAAPRPSAALAEFIKLSSQTPHGTHSPAQQLGQPTHVAPPLNVGAPMQSMPSSIDQALHSLFDQLDTDRNQHLDARELGDLTQFLRVIWKDSTAAPIGFSGSQIDRHEFVRVMQDLLHRVFSALDVNKAGVLGQMELIELERSFQYDGQDSLVRQMQANAGYRVGFNEFGMFLVANCLSKLGWGNFRSALQKIIELASMSSQSWQGVQQHLDRIFDVMDKNRSGTIEVHELGDLENVLRREWQDSSWYQMFQQQGGSVRRDVFQRFVMDILTRAFDKLDTNRDGYVDSIELQRLTHSFADQSLTQRASQFGTVRRTEFYKFVLEEMLKEASTDRFTRGISEVVRLGAPNSSWQPAAETTAVSDFNFATAPATSNLNDTLGGR